jgi:small conductance mechanosensitive channel
MEGFDQQQIMQMLTESTDLIANYAMSVIGAILILIGGLWIAGFLRRRTENLLRRTKRVDDTLTPVLGSIVRYGVIVVTIVIVLGQFGVETTSVIAVLGAAGLAIGLALQGTLQNIAAGVMLLLLSPFKVGEFITAGGVSGTVKEIGLFTTELLTADGIFVVMPNSQLWNTDITNFSRKPTRRLDILVGVAYDDDLDKGLETLMAMMQADERVLGEPEPQVMVMNLGDSAVELNARCWVNTGDYWAARWDLTKRAKEMVEAAGLTIPFPQRDVHHYNHAAAAAD